jgi:RsiW-degrading membrane proteinase PrsW (M82 family)
MPSVGALVILLFISSIPAIAVFVWYSLARYPFSLPRFSFSLLAGTVSFFPALFLQKIFTAGNIFFLAAGKWGFIAEIFRIAFTEELSRLILLVFLFFAFSRFSSSGQPEQPSISAVTMASAAGLVAGLGFAIIETAVYGASNPGNALLRTFTTAPLHGACGFRVGSSIAMFRERPVPALSRFLSAVVIHGVYNLMLRIPGIFPSIAAILIALSALASSIAAIHIAMKNDQPPLDTSP